MLLLGALVAPTSAEQQSEANEATDCVLCCPGKNVQASGQGQLLAPP
jgi:hypothetical protein